MYQGTGCRLGRLIRFFPLQQICCLRYRDGVASIVAGILGASVAPEQPLMEAGLDSLGAVDLRNALAARFDVELPATATFDYPTIAAMAQHIASSMAPAREPAHAWPDNAIVEQDLGPPTTTAAQVVGLACTYPGTAPCGWTATDTGITLQYSLLLSGQGPGGLP